MIEAPRNDFNEELRYWTKKDLIELLSDDVLTLSMHLNILKPIKI